MTAEILVYEIIKTALIPIAFATGYIWRAWEESDKREDRVEMAQSHNNVG